jgi:hypothetical protein
LKLIKLRPADFQVPYCVHSERKGGGTTVPVNYSFSVFCPNLFTASEEKQVSLLPEFEHPCNISPIHIINMYYTANKIYIPENQSTNTHS